VSDPRTDWKNELRPTGECPAIERLTGELTQREIEHVSHCAHCQAEMALWKEFGEGKTAPDEAAEVEWIANEVRRRRAAQSSNVVSIASRRKAMQPRMLAAAAMLVIAVATGYVIQNREPSINVPLDHTDVYRSSHIDVITPNGDISAAPGAVSWKAIPGATSYDLNVTEVDRTVLWHASTRETRVALPAAVVAQFVPGKTILWEVTARRDGTIVADSGTQRFRVSTVTPPGDPR
jgi:hypothetical protein